MLTVKTPEETLALIEEQFSCLAACEQAPLAAALGRVLAEEIRAAE